MRNISKKVVLCLILVMLVALTGVLTACDEGTDTTPTVTTPTYKVQFIRNYPVAESETADTTAVYTASVRQNGKVSESAVPTADAMNAMRPAGYTFAGWFTEASGGVAYSFATQITKATLVYAQWTSNNKSTDVSLSDGAFLYEEKVSVATYDKTADSQTVSNVSTGLYRYGNSATYAVPNSDKSFNFNTKLAGLTNDPNASYAIYADEACKFIASSNNIVTLVNGDNIYYIKVTAEDSVATKVYKINVYLQPLYKVTVEKIFGNGNYTDIISPANAKITLPDLAGVNPGYTAGEWYYQTAEARDENNRIIDADGNILEKNPDGNYYVVDANGNRYPVYMDKFGYTAIREGSVYYQADKNGNAILVENQKQVLTAENLYNVLDENGLPTYETSTPVVGSSYMFEYVWDDSKCIVNSDEFVFCRWTRNTYYVALDLNVANINDATFDYDENTQIAVVYGTGAEAVGNLIRNVGSNLPTHKYAKFAGWYYDTADSSTLIVNANGQGVHGWDMIPTTGTTVTLKAHWTYNTYDISTVVTDSDMGEAYVVLETGRVTESSCQYGGSVSVTAVAKTGYVFSGWTVNGNLVSTAANYEYNLNLAQLVNNGITLTANFTKIRVTVTFDYVIGSANATYPASIVAEYGANITGTGANFLPVLTDTSFDAEGKSLFEGWYYYADAEAQTADERTYLTDKNIALSGKETWTFTENMTVYAAWNPNQYSITVYNATFGDINMGSINWAADANFNVATDGEKLTKGQYTLQGRSVTEVIHTKFNLNAVVANANLYRFLGWFKIIDTEATDLISLANLEAIDTENETNPVLTDYELGDSNVSLVAIWYYKTVTITLNNADVNGVTGATLDTVEVNIDKDFDLKAYIPTTVPEDYYFAGWYRGNKAYTDASGKSVVKLTVNSNDTSIITEGLTLQVKWEPINYFVVEGGIVTGLTEAASEKVALTIPQDDYITAIAPNAFSGNTNIETITICGNITKIGEGAFANSAVKTVNFSGEFKGLTVESNAFLNCKFTNIVFPANTVEIKAGALNGCVNLTSLTYSASSVLGSLFTSSEPEENLNMWYSANQNGTEYWIPTALKTVTVSHTTSRVADYAFAYCNLDTVILAKAADGAPYTTSIGRYAFEHTSENTGIVVDTADVTAIGNYAFQYSGVTTIDLNNVVELGSNAFRASKIVSVDFSGSKLDKVPSSCFQNCTELNRVNLGNVKYIYASAFNGCTNVLISSLNDTSKILTIGANAFANSGIKVTNVSTTVFKNVTKVGEGAFDHVGFTGVSVVGKVLYYVNTTTFTAASYANVVTIASGAFGGASSPTTLNLTGMSSLVTIDSYAFANNTTISSVTLPASLQHINNNAFEGCTSLATVNMASCTSLVMIDINAFRNCTGLTTLTFLPVFNNAEDLIAAVRLSIDNYAFFGCTSLQTVNLPENLKSLGEYSFANCTRLSVVNFIKNAMFEGGWDVENNKAIDPAYVYTSSGITNLITTISAGAFQNTAITNIELPYFVSSINEYAFSGCTNLVGIDNTFVKEYNGTAATGLNSIGAYAFQNNSALQTLTILASTNVGVGSFENCTSLTGLSASIRNLPARVFNGCTSLTSINVSMSAEVGEKAFLNCTKLNSFVISGNINKVGANAFQNCALLTEVELKNATEIGTEAFKACSMLRAVTFSATIEAIGDSAFSECTSLRTVNFNNDGVLATIGDSSFAGCTLLESITLPKSVTRIGASAFAYCSALKSAVVNDAVAFIGAYAFDECDNIEVKLLGTAVPKLGGDIFTAGNNYTVLILEGYEHSFETNDDWADYSANFQTYTNRE